ncbi:hypothetical protein M422DRAFT_272034 [Sphaerobolus stellatus SS14]|uniref:Uncharacterized protein n=1 Tax=Sphaerobolus stellatus (strain SS14) TaxID=990650 RepID=A0A0C9UMX9_SPHS4|nr:hypothetical protein M422DRAFT_272034 [Sphaerobolus stellatus SS14]
MPRTSKVNLQCIKNLQPSKKKGSEPVLPPLELPESDPEDVEYCPEETGTGIDEEMIDFSGLFIIDEGMDEMDSQSDIDEDGEAEIQDDAQLLKIVTVLQDDQVAAQHEEKERMGGRKRKKHYTGNSLRSEQHHAANRRKLTQDPTHQFIERNEEQASLVTDSIGNDAEAIDEIQITSESDAPNADLESSQPLERDEADKMLQDMLHDLKDNAPMPVSDHALESLSWQDFPELRHAKVALSFKSKDSKLDVVFRSHITAMVATVNFYLDVELSYTWWEASILAAKAAGKSRKFAKNIREWLHTYLCHSKLPMHRYGCYHSSILQDEDLQEALQ